MRRFPLPVVRLGGPEEELREDGEPGVPLCVRGDRLGGPGEELREDGEPGVPLSVSGECGLAGSCCAVRFPWKCFMGGRDVGVVERCGCHNTTALGWAAEPLACSVEVVPGAVNNCRRLVEREVRDGIPKAMGGSSAGTSNPPGTLRPDWKLVGSHRVGKAKNGVDTYRFHRSRNSTGVEHLRVVVFFVLCCGHVNVVD